MLAQGGTLEGPVLEAVQAFIDYRRFGALPFAGALWQQSAELVEELRIVAEIVEEAEAARNAESR